MANIVVGIIVFGSLGAIVLNMVRNRKKNKGSCQSGCGSCPFACDKRQD